MKATVIRKFIISDKELKRIMKEEDMDEDELENYLAGAYSGDLEDICDNDLYWDTDVDFEVEE